MDENTTEANARLNREFYGESTEPTEWVKNPSQNKTVNANIEMDRIFNGEEEEEFDGIRHSASLNRGNG